MMSGHSKWSTIKHKKGASDAKRGKIFTKITKELIIAARIGGGDPDNNPRLRHAIQEAKSVSMPKDTVERAIKRGTGELGAETMEEITYEGYGPGGVAILVEVATDNKNRTVSELRNIFVNSGGKLAESGGVSYLFNYKGQLIFDSSKYTEDQVMEVAIEAGAEDVINSDGQIEVITEPGSVFKVREAFDKVGMVPIQSGFSYVPTTTVPVAGEEAQKLLRLMERLEDHDDVQKVHSNFDIDDKLLQ